MAIVKNIKTLNTNNWQHKRGTIGEVVTDLDDIEQCYETICSVQKGSVIHNPNLGWNILKYVDKPINQVMAQIKQELMTELNYQEPRAIVLGVKIKTSTVQEIASGNCKAVISYAPLNSDIKITKEVPLW